MKIRYCLLPILFAASICSSGQGADYKVVFDLTSKDTNVHRAVIRWCNLIITDHPEARLEVVYYGQSLDMITKGKSAFSADVIQLAAGRNVTFKACEASLKRLRIDKSQLLPGVQSVPDGIYEILLREREGFGYIKAAL